MQIERRGWEETFMKKYLLVLQFKVWKWNHISIAFGNYISGRKKNHGAQPCQLSFDENRNLKSKLCINCCSGKKKNFVAVSDPIARHFWRLTQISRRYIKINWTAAICKLTNQRIEKCFAPLIDLKTCLFLTLKVKHESTRLSCATNWTWSII